MLYFTPKGATKNWSAIDLRGAIIVCAQVYFRALNLWCKYLIKRFKELIFLLNYFD